MNVTNVVYQQNNDVNVEVNAAIEQNVMMHAEHRHEQILQSTLHEQRATHEVVAQAAIDDAVRRVQVQAELDRQALIAKVDRERQELKDQAALERQQDKGSVRPCRK